MKKFLIGLVILLATSLPACVTQNETNGINIAPPVAPSEVPGKIGLEAEMTTIEIPEIGFSVMLPVSWEGLFEVQVQDTAVRDMVDAYFLHKPTYDKEGWHYSRLVQFGRIRGDYTQERPPILSEACVVLANVGGYTFYYYSPNYWEDNIVAWHKESATEASVSYLELRNQIDLLVNSFRVAENALPIIEDESTSVGQVFFDETLGISLTFPAEWKGLYLTDVFINEDGARAVLTISHKATKEWNENAGSLVVISKVAGEDEYDDDRPPVMAGYCWILDKRDGYTYAASLPSDVQYDESPGSTTREEYQLLESQLNMLLRSFRLNTADGD